MNKPKLSVVLATYNEEDNIAACLESIKKLADEIVIVDGSSVDKTTQIARTYTDRVYVTSNPAIFHINKQKAIDYAKGKWILQLDADEQIPKNLAHEISETIDNKETKNGYWIARKNYFCGKWMRKGGMYPDYVIRLFKNGKGTLPCKSVHEQITIDGSVGHLKNPMKHVPYKTFNEYREKADTYTTLTAKQYQKQKLSTSFMTNLQYTILFPINTFFRLYIRHQGILDGKWGFVWAYNSALHHVQAYQKYKKYEQNNIL